MLSKIHSRLLTAAAGALLLAACGGSGTQYNAFKPVRIVNFGDEMSLLTPDAKKYSVSYIDPATQALSCTAYPLWTQTLASNYGMVYAQCNPDNLTTTTVQTQAAVGAKVADVQAQIAAVNAGSTPLGATDMVTVLVGMYDVQELYATYPVQDEATITAQLQARGEVLAAQVNALADAGSRVLIATAPDIGYSPWGLAEKSAHTDTDRAALLSRLVTAFNTAMRIHLVNDGSKIGLLLADDLSRSMAKVPGAYALSNTTDPVCAVALPDCTSNTLIPGVTVAGNYLWADALRPGLNFHSQLGLQAVSRTRTNPF